MLAVARFARCSVRGQSRCSPHPVTNNGLDAHSVMGRRCGAGLLLDTRIGSLIAYGKTFGAISSQSALSRVMPVVAATKYPGFDGA